MTALRDRQKRSERQARQGRKVETRKAPPGRLIELPNVFQPRGIGGYIDDHVDKLVKACDVDAKTGRFQPLDPIHVILVDSRYVVVDGHHRRAAYIQAGLGGQSVPIRVHRVDPVEAQRIAGRSNTRQREPMTQAQRLAYAWELVQARDNDGNWLLSKPQIADWASVSARTVGKMRHVVRTLLDEYPQVNPAEIPWWKAQRIAENGLEGNDDGEDAQGREAMMDHQAEKYAERICKALPRDLRGNPEMLARTIAKYAPGNVRAVIKILADIDGTDLEDLVEGASSEDDEDLDVPVWGR